MHNLIRKSLEESFTVLNQNLVVGDDHSKLDVVIDTLVKMINGSPCNDEIRNMFKNHPDINKKSIETDVFNIVYMLNGKHKLISECCEDEHNILEYIFDLADEIIENLNFVTIQDGNVIKNQVECIALKPEVPYLGELYITEPNNEL